MKMNQTFRGSLVLATGLLLSTAATQAALFHVTIDTSVLSSSINAPNGPYSLNFQLNDGNSLNNNTVVISNFSFTGGGPAFGAVNTVGGATGDLATSVTLTDSTTFNEFYQSFATGSLIEFDLSITQIVTAGPTPDSFSFSILEGDLDSVTTDGFGNTLVQFDINTTNPNPTLVISSGTGDFAGLTVTAVPEPSAALIGLVGCGLLLRRRRIA